MFGCHVDPATNRNNIMKKALITTALLVIPAIAQAREIRYSNCPAEVKATVEKNLDGGRVDNEVEFRKVNGASRYIVEIEGPGRVDRTLLIGPKGKLEGEAIDIRFRDRPVEVRNAVRGLMKSGWRVDDVDRVVEGGVIRFHVEIDRPSARDLQFTLTPTGEVVKREIGDSWTWY